MINLKSTIVATAAAALLALPVIVSARAQSFSEPQRGEIEKIIKDYIVSHPEVLQEAMAELEKRQAAAEAEKAKVAVKKNEEAIFSSAHQVTIGNPQGDVTLVEFFDYNCGYCKRALSDLMDLMKGGTGRGRRAHAGPDRQEIS
jgi:protein-disulfide isomerase